MPPDNHQDKLPDSTMRISEEANQSATSDGKRNGPSEEPKGGMGGYLVSLRPCHLD